MNNYKAADSLSFHQNMVINESESVNEAESIQIEDNFKSVLNLISQVNFELGPTAENISTVTCIFDQLTILCQKGAPIINLPVNYMKLLFSLPGILKENNSQEAYALYLSMSNFLLEFSLRTDFECCGFIETGYITALFDIADFSKGTLALFNALSSLANLLHQKPMTGEKFPHLKCYQVVHSFIILIHEERAFFLFDLSFIQAGNQHEFFHKYVILEILYNLMIFLPHKFNEILKQNPSQNRRNIETYLHHVFMRSRQFNDAEHLILVTRGINIFWRIFYYGSVALRKEFETPEVLRTLISELGRYSDIEIDQGILFCLTKIAASGGTHAKFILNKGFGSYLPPPHEKKSILLFCKTWESIVSNLGVNTSLHYSRPAGIMLLKSVSDNLIAAAQDLLVDEDFEILAETTLIFAAIVNSKDAELVEKILTKCPNFPINAQLMLEQQNPENVVKILQAISTLHSFVEARGEGLLPGISEWFRSDELYKAIAEAQEALSEYKEIEEEAAKLILEIQNSANQDNST